MDVAAMIGAPGDPEWSVWADHLQTLGDPRGELIALERLPELERSPAQVERLAALYQPHLERVEGHFRALLPGGWLAREVRCWRFGYAVELSLAQPMPVPEQPSYSALFGADELRCLSSLHLSLDPVQVEPFLDAVERHRPPLTELVFFSDDAEADFDERACERLWAALPALQHVGISPSTRFAHINHSSLTTISLLRDSSGISHGHDFVARSTLPALVRLKDFGELFEPWHLGALLEDPQVVSLFERLEVLECPFLSHDLHLDNQRLEASLDVASRLRSPATIVTLHPGQLASTIRERLPQLVFEFVGRHDWRFPEVPKLKGRATLGWSCGQPNLELPEGALSRCLAVSWAALDTEQRRRAEALILALDASEHGRAIELGIEALPRVEAMRGMMQERPLDWFRFRNAGFSRITDAIGQHRVCCSKVVLTVGACAEERSGDSGR